MHQPLLHSTSKNVYMYMYMHLCNGQMEPSQRTSSEYIIHVHVCLLCVSCVCIPVMCSDDEEMTSSLIPDNDRAVKSKKTTRSTRGQRSSSRRHHGIIMVVVYIESVCTNDVIGVVAVSQTQTPPPPSVMMTGHWFSGADESLSQSLTRTPIHRHKTRLTKLTSPHRTTGGCNIACISAVCTSLPLEVVYLATPLSKIKL